jgi:hypothetical protein
VQALSFLYAQGIYLVIRILSMQKLYQWHKIYSFSALTSRKFSYLKCLEDLQFYFIDTFIMYEVFMVLSITCPE